jgi:hypothetical protein
MKKRCRHWCIDITVQPLELESSQDDAFKIYHQQYYNRQDLSTPISVFFVCLFHVFVSKLLYYSRVFALIAPRLTSIIVKALCEHLFMKNSCFYNRTSLPTAIMNINDGKMRVGIFVKITSVECSILFKICIKTI